MLPECGMRYFPSPTCVCWLFETPSGWASLEKIGGFSCNLQKNCMGHFRCRYDPFAVKRFCLKHIEIRWLPGGWTNLETKCFIRKCFLFLHYDCCGAASKFTRPMLEILCQDSEFKSKIFAETRCIWHPGDKCGCGGNFFFLIFHKFSTKIEHAKRENHPQICSNKQSRVLMQTTTVNCISTSFSHSRNVWQPMAFWRPGTWAAPNGLG
jgi:hypothetical protein